MEQLVCVTDLRAHIELGSFGTPLPRDRAPRTQSATSRPPTSRTTCDEGPPALTGWLAASHKGSCYGAAGGLGAAADLAALGRVSSVPPSDESVPRTESNAVTVSEGGRMRVLVVNHITIAGVFVGATRTLQHAVEAADEPTSGVDGANRERVIDALRREAADAAVAVMSTHATGRPPPDRSPLATPLCVMKRPARRSGTESWTPGAVGAPRYGQLSVRAAARPMGDEVVRVAKGRSDDEHRQAPGRPLASPVPGRRWP
jgi:hypothetical protein